MSRLRLVLKAGWDARGDTTDGIFFDGEQPMISPDLLAKMFKDMSFTGMTPWQEFQQVVANALKMDSTARAPLESLANEGWQSIARRFLVPNTLPNQLNVRTGRFEERESTAKTRCKEWMEFIKNWQQQEEAVLPTLPGKASTFSKSVQSKAVLARFYLKELGLIPTFKGVDQAPLWNEETPPFSNNKPYKILWSEVQFMARMGALEPKGLFRLLRLAVQYPFDVQEATLLVETWRAYDGPTAVRDYLTNGDPYLSEIGAPYSFNGELLKIAMSGGNDAMRFVLNINPTVDQARIEGLVESLVDYRNQNEVVQADAVDMLETLRSLSNWKYDFGSEEPLIKSWSDFEELSKGDALYDNVPPADLRFYHILRKLTQTIVFSAISNNVSASFFKALTSAYLERISAVFRSYDAATFGKALLCAVCRESQVPGMIFAVMEMEWGGNGAALFDKDYVLAFKCFKLLSESNRNKPRMLNELKIAFPLWFEDPRLRDKLRKYVLEYDAHVTAGGQDKSVVQWITANFPEVL